MSEPIFMQNRIFSGKVGGESAYYMQNVMESDRPPAHRAHRVPVRSIHDHSNVVGKFKLCSDEEFELLRKWTRGK